jgi:hypothetical protein
MDTVGRAPPVGEERLLPGVRGGGYRGREEGRRRPHRRRHCRLCSLPLSLSRASGYPRHHHQAKEGQERYLGLWWWNGRCVID